MPSIFRNIFIFYFLSMHIISLVRSFSLVSTTRFYSSSHSIVSKMHRKGGAAFMATTPSPSVLIPVADGTEEIEAVTIIDTLVRAGVFVTVASVSNKLGIVCSRGVQLTSNRLISECLSEKWDMIVCPGGMPGAQHLSESIELTDLLRFQFTNGKYIAAICAAPAVVLAKHNLLGPEKKATCYPAEKFTSQIPNYSKDTVVVDGNIITSAGPGTALKFSLQLVEILCGSEKANSLKSEMLAGH